MSNEHAQGDSFDVAAEEAQVVNSDPKPDAEGAGSISRAKPRRSKAPVFAAGVLAIGVAGAVFAVFARGDDAASSRMVRVPENIDTTPAGQQLAKSDNYRQTLNASNDQGSQQAASTPDQSFLATPDEPTRPVDPSKDPIAVKEPVLPPPNERKVEVREKIVYRDRFASGVVSQTPSLPQTDWESIDAMAKRMANQGNGLSGAWKVGKSKNTVVIEQQLYTAHDGRRTGVQVGRANASESASTRDADTQRDRGASLQRDRLVRRKVNASPVETIPQDSSYHADLSTSLPYLSVASSGSEPRLQVSNGQRTGSGTQLFTGDYYATAGSITYAVIVNGSDTDTPGPVVAKIMRGPLKGSRLIGSFNENAETTAMVVQFNRVVLPDGTNLDASAYAIDPAKGTLAVKSEYDARLLQRYGSRLAGAFLGGIGRTLSQTESTIVPLGVTGAGIAQPRPQLEQGLYAAAGEVGDQLANEIEDMGPEGPIVRLNAGKLIGVLFTENVERF